MVWSVWSKLKPRGYWKNRKFRYLSIDSSWTLISKYSSRALLSSGNDVSLLVFSLFTSTNVVVGLSQSEIIELYITWAILSLVWRFPGSFLIFWYILQIPCLRLPYSLLRYWYILSYVSKYLCGLRRYMVYDSRKT